MASQPPNLAMIQEEAPALVDLHLSNPSLNIVTKSSPSFPQLKGIFNLDIQHQPLAIIRVLNTEDVAVAVRYLSSNNVPLTVRGGGHDFWGRSMAENAVVIDIRDLCSIEIVDNGSAAIIGGGILQEQLVTDLQEKGYCTATGTCPSVGFVGWATVGGMGLRSASYGLGCDQIISAKLVTYSGDVIDADENLLWGIRGGGGNFGVIVQLKIKIYPAIKGLGGFILFQSDDFEAQYTAFLKNYRELISSGLPLAYGAMPAVGNLPNLGRTIVVIFVWNSNDHEQGRIWLGRIKTCGTAIADTVVEKTPVETLQMTGEFALPAFHLPGGAKTVSIPQDFSDKYVDVAARNIAQMPSDGATFTSFHHLHGRRPTEKEEIQNSCFHYREQHLMLEILGGSLDPVKVIESSKWSAKFHQELRQEKQMILTGGYVPLMRPGIVDASEFFGEHWERLLDLKKKYDPKNVFRFASPQLM